MTNRAPTAFLLHPAAALHDTGWGHPEHQGRLRYLASTVGRDMMALHGRVEQFTSNEPVSTEDLLRVHTTAHIERVKGACESAVASGEIIEIDPDTKVSDASWEAATGSAGAGVAAALAVAEGKFRNAFVATRPPGHHATPDTAMGFCLFNNVAIAARALQSRGLAERVLIVDWDVHHGNGTQDIFWADGSVAYLSLHQSPFWPGTGLAAECGEGEGLGTTHNFPLPAGTSGEGFRQVLAEGLAAATTDFKPDFILVSAGFDALASDPLGGMALEPSDFHELTRQVMTLADQHCDGRIVAMLEGGYEPKRTGLATVAVVRALAGIAQSDPTLPAD